MRNRMEREPERAMRNGPNVKVPCFIHAFWTEQVVASPRIRELKHHRTRARATAER